MFFGHENSTDCYWQTTKQQPQSETRPRVIVEHQTDNKEKKKKFPRLIVMALPQRPNSAIEYMNTKNKNKDMRTILCSQSADSGYADDNILLKNRKPWNI